MDTKKIATRDAFGEEIIAQGLANPNIYVIDADIGKSCKTTNFMKQLPEQHLNVGIAEQCAVAVAAGLATTGKSHLLSHTLYLVLCAPVKSCVKKHVTRI